MEPSSVLRNARVAESLRCRASLLTLLLVAVPAAHAGTLAEVFHVTPTTGSVSGSGATFAGLPFTKNVTPPLSMDQVTAGTSASVDPYFGRLSSGSSVQAILNIDSPSTQSGQVNHLHGSNAKLTDILHWSGLSPLVFDLDLDWSFLFANLDINVGASDPGAAAWASLDFHLTLTGFPGAEAYSRTFTYTRSTYPTLSTDSWRLTDGNFSVVEQGSTFNGTSFLRNVVLPSAGLPTAVGVTFELGTSAYCYLEPHQGQQQCWSASLANSTGFLQVTGDYTSENGYSYPGRQTQGGSPVPEPATAATVAAALVLLAAQKWRPQKLAHQERRSRDCCTKSHPKLAGRYRIPR